jgi:Flp pilus assembly protein TadG
MGKKIKNEKGLLSLEACIAVTIFIFLMLFLYSFFVVFEVRNEMGHVTLATANSMSLDAYENDTLGESDTIGQIFYNVYGQATNSQNDFTDFGKWYDDSTVTDENGNVTLSAEFAGVVKARFIAYLTSGDADKAEEILKRYHVVNGVDGLDFSGSHISDGKLYLSVKYEIEYEFNVFNLGSNKFEHKACSKLWK